MNKNIVNFSYHPNINHARVAKRIKRAYGFAKGFLSEKPRWLSKSLIDKYFGQQQNNLAQWLRRKLLANVSNYYSIEHRIAKSYTLNAQGADEIKAMLMNIDANHSADFDYEIVNQAFEEDWHDELSNCKFKYLDKSDRLWHPLQNIRQEYRSKLFAKYNLSYAYDIVTCAPNLIHQHAQQQKEPMDEYLYSLRYYIKNKNSVRADLANKLQVDISIVKTILNSFFCGARLGCGKYYAISYYLNHDKSKIDLLRNDKYIIQLRKDIKTCWDYIKPSMQRKVVIDKNNKQRFLPLSNRDKWQRYFQLERKIIDSVDSYMSETNNHCFLVHDGWYAEKQIDVDKLSAYIKAKTNYDIQISETIK